MGSSALAAYDGDVVLARAAQAAGIPSIVSAASLTKLERVAQEAPGRWFQAYLPGEADRIEPLVERVGRAGFDVLVLTVDVAAPGTCSMIARVLLAQGVAAKVDPQLRAADLQEPSKS